MTIDPNKISTIIGILNEGLKNQESYRAVCNFNLIEIQELKKHFNITGDGEIRNNNILIFSHK